MTGNIKGNTDICFSSKKEGGLRPPSAVSPVLLPGLIVMVRETGYTKS
ncbi:hypothetical protein [Sinomicrobium soli]|nr:hypothetical protein [Sinomicrobium sp. N-1-3-6]